MDKAHREILVRYNISTFDWIVIVETTMGGMYHLPYRSRRAMHWNCTYTGRRNGLPAWGYERVHNQWLLKRFPFDRQRSW